MLSRRFAHDSIKAESSEGFNAYPDLIMIDGGRGQAGAVCEVLNRLKIDIPVCGMVKDDSHRTRGLYYNEAEIFIDRRSEAFKLITRIQDEVHRFAIEYHRSLRSKTQVKSVLDDIKGIGVVRRKALIKHFNDIEAIKAAQLAELKAVAGMDSKSAQSVYDFFHKA